MRKITAKLIAFLITWLLVTCLGFVGIIAGICLIEWDLPVWSSIDWKDFRVASVIAFFFLIQCLANRKRGK